MDDVLAEIVVPELGAIDHLSSDERSRHELLVLEAIQLRPFEFVVPSCWLGVEAAGPVHLLLSPLIKDGAPVRREPRLLKH